MRRLLLGALVSTLLPEMVKAAAAYRTVQRRRCSNGGRRRGAEVTKEVRHRQARGGGCRNGKSVGKESLVSKRMKVALSQAGMRRKKGPEAKEKRMALSQDDR
jgi:hypothetical protein